MYTYKGKKYKILQEAQMKDLTTRHWFDCVIYQQIESGLVFVREIRDFKNKFEKI